jgi:hypothetical protein
MHQRTESFRFFVIGLSIAVAVDTNRQITAARSRLQDHGE